MTRLRKLLVPGFTRNACACWLDQWLTDNCLDDMQAHDMPQANSQLPDHLGWRLPVLVLAPCSASGRGSRSRDAPVNRMGDIRRRRQSANAELREYMRRLIDVKRRDLGNNVISV